MDLKDLKNTWNKMSTGNKLNETQLQTMLTTRSHSLIERVDRNVKIGFILLALFIVWVVFDNTILSPYIYKKVAAIMPAFNLETPGYLDFIDGFIDAFSVSTFVCFAIKYFLIKKKCVTTCNIRNNLRKIIGILTLYKWLFYSVITFILIEFTLAFAHGIKIGYEYHNIDFSNFSVIHNIFVIATGAIFWLFLTGGTFLLLRWGFNRLYGKYLKRIKATLIELEEMNE